MMEPSQAEAITIVECQGTAGTIADSTSVGGRSQGISVALAPARKLQAGQVFSVEEWVFLLPGTLGQSSLWSKGTVHAISAKATTVPRAMAQCMLFRFHTRPYMTDATRSG